MIYPSDFEDKIGFTSIRANISDKCSSRMGKQEVEKMRFSNDYATVIDRLRCVSEMVSIIESGKPFPLGNIHDIIPALNEIRAQSSYMSAENLFKLMSMLIMIDELTTFFAQESSEDSKGYPALSRVGERMNSFPIICSTIARSVNKFGEIKDNATPELHDIRLRMKSAQGSMQRAMRRVLDSAIAAGIVDKDATPSMRDGRLVLPVTAGNKREIRGIVHDESATGKTVFIEPAEVVEAGNTLRKLEIEEMHEIVRILTSISAELRPHIDELIESCKVIGIYDFINAKARFAREVDAQMPTVHKEVELEWYHAVHPGLFLALRPQGRSVVPLNLTLNKEQRILIISGPNAGGKSVCLKTVAVVQYMMQCGLLPTLYYNSHMGIFEKIFIDIGDEQSFENDLSTYSSHLKNMKFFLLNANKRTILLADEMGSGTEPQIGGAMAQAILTQLASTGCYGVITTHYQNLKTFADETEGFVNGAMLYDREHLQPTFELSVGNPGSSFAIDIARKIGLPGSVIDMARDIAGSDYVNLDKYLSDITRDRRYWANKRQNIREKENKLDSLLRKYEETAGELTSQRKSIIRDAQKEAAEILKSANARIERTILEIRQAQAEKEKTKSLRNELKEFADTVTDGSISASETPDALKPLHHKSKKRRNDKPTQNTKTVSTPKEIKAGDYVKMKDGNTIGQVLSIQGKKAEVAFGALRTFVELSRLESSRKPKESALSASSSISISTDSDSRRRQLNFKNEIDVRGMRADEALQAVTYFIDDAIQFNASRVRILHGTGHGILKTLIRQQLKANTAVANFADEDVRFGGAGITVVDFD